MPTVKDVMIAAPVALEAQSSVIEAARQMKEQGIGDVIVVDGDRIRGLVTDRDIVVRAVAEEKDPRTTQLAEISTEDLVSVKPDDDLKTAGDLMRDKAIRRLPVVEEGRPVGIVSIGDLALERDPDSPLATISAADPNN